MAVQQSPCISLYQPTHRHYRENQQDPIVFRNLVKEIETSLQQAYPEQDISHLLEPFESLADDHDFWEHTLDGLVVLAGFDVFHVFKLQQPVSQQVVVADSFHTKPLRRFLQSVDRYQILGLSNQKVQFLLEVPA
jgi:hypothetical protein